MGELKKQKRYQAKQLCAMKKSTVVGHRRAIAENLDARGAGESSLVGSLVGCSR